MNAVGMPVSVSLACMDCRLSRDRATSIDIAPMLRITCHSHAHNVSLLCCALRVTTTGPLLVSRALLPNLRLAKSPRIVNITSRMGSIADNTSGGSYGYRASKAALNAFTKSWAIDVADVPAVLVHPGYIATDMCGGKGDMGAEECVQRIWTSVLEEFLKEGGGRVKAGAFMHRDGQELPW